MKRKFSNFDTEKLKGTIFLICFIGSAVGFVVSSIFSKFLLAIGFFIFAILSWVVAAIISHFDTKKYKESLAKKVNYKKVEGIVQICEQVIDFTKKPLGTPSEYNYKLTISLNNKAIVTFYRKPFNKGDKVFVMVSDYYPESFYNKYIVVEK